MIASLITSAPGASIRKFTPKGRSVSAFTRSIARVDLLGRDRRRGEEAEGAGVAGAAATSSGVATQPMPVWMIG